MRFLVDAQLPPALARWLQDHGQMAEHVGELGMAAADQRSIWAYALAAGAVIITKDEDMAARRATVADGALVIWVRRGNTTGGEFLAWFEPLWPDVLGALKRGEPLTEII